MSTNYSPIFYYAHHQGSGHVQRGRQILEAVRNPAVLFSTYPLSEPMDNADFVQLSEDHAHLSKYQQNLSPLPDALHHAPLGVTQIRHRMYEMAQRIYWQNPALMVTDVSVEITLLARLCSIPAVAVRLAGLRNDLPHLQAFQSARKLIFPLPKIFEHPETPVWIRKKTHYMGGFSRYDGRQLSKQEARNQVNLSCKKPLLVIVNGMYGEGHSMDYFYEMAQELADWEIIILGKTTAHNEVISENLHCVGIVPDTFPYLKAATVVVGSAGDNTMMEIAAAETPYICIPEERPFAEQTGKKAGLKAYDLAIVLKKFPQKGEWIALLEKAKKLDGKNWQPFRNENAVVETAQMLEDLAKENQAF